MQRSKCIVITGSIGCGKSSVCRILRDKGYDVIDADEISKEVAKKLLPEIITMFGGEFIKNGELDRKKLGKLVFEDKSAKRRLEELLHPAIKSRIYQDIERLSKVGKLFFIDIPLFFESKNYKELSPIAVVYSTREQQLARVKERDGLSDADAENRIKSQIDIEEKAKKADFVIDNSGDKEILPDKIDIFLNEVDRWFCKNTAQAETTF